MPSFLYVGLDTRVFPSADGVTQSFQVEPGDTVEADVNPDVRLFDETQTPDTPGGDVTPTADTGDGSETPTVET